MKDLKEFIAKIPEFYSFGPGRQIKYFIYFLQMEKQYEAVKAKDISICFDFLHINSHSNIPMYLSRGSKKSAEQQFLKKENGYVLFAPIRESISEELGKPIEINASDSLFPQLIFHNTRGYLISFAGEASKCYDLGLYNSCLFMLRKITETLIIELYESKSIQTKIINNNGDYFQLSDLIKSVTTEPSWKLSKIVKENLPKIKLLADSSVHSKRFSAKRPDIDLIKTNIRIVFEELISHINYERWNLIA